MAHPCVHGEAGLPESHHLCTELVACVDKHCHLAFGLESYSKAVCFRGALLVKSKHCLWDIMNEAFLCHCLTSMTVTRQANHSPKQDDRLINCHQTCPPPHCSPPQFASPPLSRCQTKPASHRSRHTPEASLTPLQVLLSASIPTAPPP